MKDKNRCINLVNHTPSPVSYFAFFDWAEEKSKTHKQVKCPACGLYVIWIPLTESLTNAK